MLTMMSFDGDGSKVKFVMNDIPKAKALAGENCKLFFVDFVANYCYTCTHMDETVFTDPSLASYIDKNYIPVKVDVENFDGFSEKIRYNIKNLPTFIIFNSEGEIVGRYEGGKGISEMKEILEKHNKPANKCSSPIVTPPAPPQPKPIPELPEPPIESPKPPVKPDVPRTDDKPASPKPPVIIPAPTSASQPANEGTGRNYLVEFDVKAAPNTGYGIQIQAFRDYGNVIQQVPLLKKHYNMPIIVNVVDDFENKPWFKVVLGRFGTIADAQAFQAQLKQEGVDGLLRNYADYYQ